MLTQPKLDLSALGLIWPSDCVYVVVYFSRSSKGVWATSPDVEFFTCALKADLWMFDLYTRSLQEGTAYTGVMHLKGAATTHVFKYP